MPLAPLHQPHNLAPIRILAASRPQLPQVACFDTAFHRRPALVRADLRAAPGTGRRGRAAATASTACRTSTSRSVWPRCTRNWRTAASSSATWATASSLTRGARRAQRRPRRWASPRWTALPMGTRCGAVDPGVLLYLMNETGMDAARDRGPAVPAARGCSASPDCPATCAGCCRNRTRPTRGARSTLFCLPRRPRRSAALAGCAGRARRAGLHRRHRRERAGGARARSASGWPGWASPSTTRPTAAGAPRHLGRRLARAGVRRADERGNDDRDARAGPAGRRRRPGGGRGPRRGAAMLDRTDPRYLLRPDDPAAGYALAAAAPAPGDALTPDAVARAAEAMGLKKAHATPARQFVLAVLGGAFVALGAMFATVAIAGAENVLPYGVMRLLMGAAFSMGLMLVVVAGAQLFTSDALMVLAWAGGRLDTRRMLRSWTVVWLGNLVGALGTAVLVFLGGQYGAGHGEVGASALYLAASKAGLAPGKAFFLAVLCNVLVCLAVWLSLAARSVTDKVLAMFLPVTAFVAAGFEHCVANMYFVPYGLLVQRFAPAGFWAEPAVQARAAAEIPLQQFALNLGVVTLGNWVGGALLVAGVYGWLYRREGGGARPV
ncbi:MAG: formate/nitrite transporter family protein [Comamonadaceae bacterium]|nr:formate/nitrite transporter family protein [Comamonadaceae bacterium]